MSRSRRRQAGFTLIEMMIALLISMLFSILILSIFSRMSFSFHTQSAAVGMEQELGAAKTLLEVDAKQAGLAVSQGFKLARDGAGTTMRSPIRIVNSNTGPDEIGFYYADPSAQAAVTANVVPPINAANKLTSVTVDNVTGFAANDLVVLSTPSTFVNPINASEAVIVQFDACVLQIASIAGTTVNFQTSGSWGSANNDHCTGGVVANSTMLYKFVARAWRIDPTRPGLGALQLDTTGDLLATPTWNDMGYDFTDLQASTYFYDNDTDPTDSADPDTDGARDWYSSTEQDTYTQNHLVTVPYMPPLLMSISLVARTDTDAEGVYSQYTPNLADPTSPAPPGTPGTNVSHNMVGDHSWVDTNTTANAALTGRRVYRYIRFQVDLRNLGVGR